MLLVGIDDDEVFPRRLWAGPLPAAGLLGLVDEFAHGGGRFFILIVELVAVVVVVDVVVDVVVVVVTVVVVVLCKLERCIDEVVRIVSR